MTEGKSTFQSGLAITDVTIACRTGKPTPWRIELPVAKAAHNGVCRALMPSLGGDTACDSGTTRFQAPAVPMAEWAGRQGEGGKAASRRSDVGSWHDAY